jgi:PST family polysaccharide transporter
MNTLRSQSLNAAFWSTGGQLVRSALTFVTFTILARPLDATEFGLLGMVLVITNFANVFTDSGFNRALVHKSDTGEQHFSSVFWFNVVAGLALTLLFVLGAPLVAAFYKNPDVAPVCRLISLCFILHALTLVQAARLIKALQFRRLTLCEIAAQFVGALAAVLLAYSGWGVWSLAAQALLMPASLSLLLWFGSDWRPTLLFRRSALRELFGFSANLLGTGVLNYWTRNIDNLLIGRFLGDQLLGYYTRAYSVMMMPVTNISNALSRVLFPSLSAIQEDRDSVRRVFLKVTRVTAFVTYPATLGLAVVAPQFVEVVFGAKWLPMASVLQILCFVSLIQSTSSLIGNIYLSQGRADLQFRVSFILRLLPVIGIVIGLRWGIEGVAAGYLAGVILNQVPNLWFAGGLVNMGIAQYFRQIAPTTACSVAMALLVWAGSLWLNGRIPLWSELLVEVIAGVGIYLALAWAVRLRSMVESFQMFREMFPRLAGWPGRAAPRADAP